MYPNIKINSFRFIFNVTPSLVRATTTTCTTRTGRRPVPSSPPTGRAEPSLNLAGQNTIQDIEIDHNNHLQQVCREIIEFLLYFILQAKLVKGTRGDWPNFPLGQLSNITTRWRHQAVIKEREIEVNNFYQNFLSNNDFLQLLYREIMVILLYRARDVLQYKLVEGTRGNEKLLISLCIKNNHTYFLTQAVICDFFYSFINDCRNDMLLNRFRIKLLNILVMSSNISERDGVIDRLFLSKDSQALNKDHALT